MFLNKNLTNKATSKIICTLFLKKGTTQSYQLAHFVKTLLSLAENTDKFLGHSLQLPH